jgi:YbbR domain-containing protein
MQSNGSGGINKFNLVLSIIIAFAAWFYVVYNINPTMSKTYRDVPVKVVGTSELKANDMAVESLSFDTIDVSVKGRRSQLNRLKTSDIKVTADVSDAGKGENTIAVNVELPSGLTLRSQSETSIEINVQDRVTKKVVARAVFKDDSDGEPYTVDQSSSEVEVSGARSLVEKVSYVQLPLNSTKVTSSDKTFSVNAVPVDSSGNRVERVTCDPKKVSVTAVNATTKEVTLNVKVKDSGSDEYTRTYTAPHTVFIKGRASDIKDITSIDTKTIDISDVTQSQKIALTYDLPDGVEIANESIGQTLNVKVVQSASKTYTIKSSQIEVRNLGDGLSANVSDDVKVTVRGSSDQLDSLSSGSISAYVDASGLSAGTHSLTVHVSAGDVKNVSADPSSVTVTIQ